MSFGQLPSSSTRSITWLPSSRRTLLGRLVERSDYVTVDVQFCTSSVHPYDTRLRVFSPLDSHLSTMSQKPARSHKKKLPGLTFLSVSQPGSSSAATPPSSQPPLNVPTSSSSAPPKGPSLPSAVRTVIIDDGSFARLEAEGGPASKRRRYWLPADGGSPLQTVSAPLSSAGDLFDQTMQDESFAPLTEQDPDEFLENVEGQLDEALIEARMVSSLKTCNLYR